MGKGLTYVCASWLRGSGFAYLACWKGLSVWRELGGCYRDVFRSVFVSTRNIYLVLPTKEGGLGVWKFVLKEKK